jgi:hypothetical protein
MIRCVVTLRREFLLAGLLVGVLSASGTRAGTVYLIEVVDPPTTAGAGIAPIPGGGSSMAVTSTRSGPGTWHLYAIDDADGSAGIRGFFIKLDPGPGGTIPATNNRSPVGNWDTDPVYGNGTPSNVGFDLLRSATPLPIGVQSPTNTVQIGGFGITAGNFQASTGAGSYQLAPTSGQWGNYSDPYPVNGPAIIGASGHLRSAVFLAEGTYTGSHPTIDVTTPFGDNATGILSWVANGFPNAGSFTTGVGVVGTQQLAAIYIIAPEPATAALVGLAVVGFAGLVGRHRT